MTTVLTFEVHLDEPTIFAALAGDPNSRVSFPYMPGSAMRGVMIGRYMKREGIRELDATDEVAQRLFFSQTTRYLNAYPLIGEQRALPIPATWTHPKYLKPTESFGSDGKDPIYLTDTALTESDTERTETKRKPKNLSGFTHINGGRAFIYKPSSQINVHTRRARRGAAEQQVFRYEALATEQRFGGVILCDDDQDTKQLMALLKYDSRVTFGGSRTAGYGQTRLMAVQDVDGAEWREFDGVKPQDQAILTFLSDTLLLDEMGTEQPTPVGIQAVLNQAGVICDVEPISINTSWVGGFNRKWGLPLPQQLVIEAGSVVRLTGLTADAATLQKLYWSGIGQRREDGFGRVAVGWQDILNDHIVLQKYHPEQVPVAPELEGEAKTLWERFSSRFEEKRLEHRLARVVYDPKSDYIIKGSITRTQLARLRMVIADELRKPTPNVGRLGMFVTSVEGKAAGKQLANARIRRQSLSDWLISPALAEQEADIAGEPRALLKLMDYILERAHRDRGKQAKEGSR